MTTSILLSPSPNQTIVCTSGAAYTSDQNGIITGVSSSSDVTDLVSAGCAVLSPPPTNLLFSKLGANFNSTGDQILTPTFKGASFRITKIVVVNTSVNGMATAAGGVYTAASKATGQGVLVAAGQVYTGLTNPQTALELTLALPSLILSAGTSIYFSLTTGHGSAATADIYVFGEVYS
jgi:subtilisin family serine protease